MGAGTPNYVFINGAASTTWSIAHNQNNSDFVVNVFDATDSKIIPDSVTIVDANNVTITFAVAADGKAVFIFASGAEASILHLVDEFTINGAEEGEYGELGWVHQFVTSDGSLVERDAESSHPGILRMSTSAISGSFQSLHLGDVLSAQSFLVSDIDRVKFIVRPVSTVGVVRVGLATDTTDFNLGTDSVFFEFDPATDSSWHTVTRDTSTSTDLDTGVVVAAQWYQLEFVRVSSASYQFYINGTLVTTHATNLPDNNVVNATIQVVNNDAALRSVDIDLFEIRTIDLGDRWD